ncbi:hypothetical protein ACFY7C_02120 [Streptomyces sp. NPDC012769]|uniref:hypothetical protein n=1 Tax=Streptomyces sp. NPDC012769 TaxID=3364848 RepID=UPI00367F8C11
MADKPNETPDEEVTRSRQQASDKAREASDRKARSARERGEDDEEPPQSRGAIASDRALKTDVTAVAW